MARADTPEWQLINEAVVSHRAFLNAERRYASAGADLVRDIQEALAAGVAVEELKRSLHLSAAELLNLAAPEED